MAQGYGCSSLPNVNEADRMVTTALSGETSLSQMISGFADSNPGKTGIVVLDQGKQAYIKRSILADMAEESIDAQYYIWQDEITGKLLAARMINAANRGVRVRLLLDDIGSSSSEKMLTVMNSHPNIDIRIYNPVRPGMRFGIRKVINFLFEFSRLNQRMHNKTFTVDGVVTIAGGRNIGDEYFANHATENFIDLDLMVVGKNVPEVSSAFDLYWNSGAAIPLSILAGGSETIRHHQEGYVRLLQKPERREYPWVISGLDDMQKLKSSLDSAIWAESDFVYDKPLDSESEFASNETGAVWKRLLHEFEQTEKEALIESAYFIVLDKSMSGVKRVRDSGVNISVLTNSLATNDLWLVHAGYSGTRNGLLQNGVELYEFRPDAGSCLTFIDVQRLCDDVNVSLHAKTSVFDRERVFVGSFNLNPRSAYLNSEMAFVVKSKQLAQQVAAGIKRNMEPESSWKVSLNDEQQLQWVSQYDGKEKVYLYDPGSSIWQRARNYIFSLLPFDKYY